MKKSKLKWRRKNVAINAHRQVKCLLLCASDLYYSCLLAVLGCCILLNRTANVCGADDVLQKEDSSINGDEKYTLTGKINLCMEMWLNPPVSVASCEFPLHLCAQGPRGVSRLSLSLPPSLSLSLPPSLSRCHTHLPLTDCLHPDVSCAAENHSSPNWLWKAWPRGMIIQIKSPAAPTDAHTKLAHTAMNPECKRSLIVQNMVTAEVQPDG